MDKFPLRASAWLYLGWTLALALVASALGHWYLYLPLWLAAAFVAFFFRDPARICHLGPEAILSPADGRVVHRGEASHPWLEPGRCQLVSIFMGLADVHVNRLPAAGTIEAVVQRPGGFKAAFRPEAGQVNERLEVLLRTAGGWQMVVCQVAGVVARRIECDLVPGQEVQRGRRYGMIRFGSRLDVYLPLQVKITVDPGQRVKAGLSPIGVC